MTECQYVKRLRPATMYTSREAFKHFTQTIPEITKATDVNHSLITLFFKRIQTRERIVGKGLTVTGIKESTLASYASRLKTFFKWLKEQGHINANPFDMLKLPKPIFEDHRALTGEEIKKIITAVVQNSSNSFLAKRDLAMISVLTFCGLRRNELLSLRLMDVDLFNEFITIQPHTSKSKKLRKVPINLHLKMHLHEYLQERKKRSLTCPYLFVTNAKDKRFELPGLKHWVRKISSLSKVKFHIHRFRHTFATNLAMQNVSVVKIQKLMGHSDLKMTQTYLRSIHTEDMHEDMNRLSFENLA